LRCSTVVQAHSPKIKASRKIGAILGRWVFWFCMTISLKI